MPDSRPNPNIWGNIITCGEIAIGIYEIVGEYKKGLMMPKKMAEEILPQTVIDMAQKDGENLCFTDELPSFKPNSAKYFEKSGITGANISGGCIFLLLSRSCMITPCN
jgi:hypothetical protein